MSSFNGINSKKFKLSRQRQDLRTLNDDPAFSADPHSNPYSVTHLGHPVLKNKNRSIPHDSDSHSDFHLVQPPNSPIVLSSTDPSPQQPFQVPLTTHNNKLSSVASPMNQGFTSSITPQGDRPSSLLPPLKTENKRMTFLSRRKTAQPQAITSFFSFGKKERRRSEPAHSDDTTLPPRPVQRTEDLLTSASVAPSQIPEHKGRVQDLDQIDELDETNPWGIPIHHDGPYEAANVQLNKRVANRHLGLAGSNEPYNMHTHQANEQIYIPPQVPTGVPLNLSPGQILPRQFIVPFNKPARMTSMPSSYGPYTPRIPTRPVLTAPHKPQYMATFPDANSGFRVQNNLPPIQETMQRSDDLSFDIGMAMLEPGDNDAHSRSPRVFLSPAELLDEQDFDPYDSINLESVPRRVPSPLVSAQPEPAESQNASSSSVGNSSEKLDVIQRGHSRNSSDPPMYDEVIGNENAGHQLLNESPSQEDQQLQLSSQTPRTSQIPAGTGLQQHSNKSDNGHPPNGSRNLNFSPPDRNIPCPLAVTPDQRVEVARGIQDISPAQNPPPLRFPRRDSLPSPSVNRGNEPDVQSTHHSNHSTSTYSSSQLQHGRKPPSNRYLPKQLVMPAPLNTGQPPHTTTPLHIGRVPHGQVSPHVNANQTHFQRPPFNRTPLNNLPMAPIHHHGNTRAEDVPMSGGRSGKLRKRASIIDTPTPAPVITSVSFAPPITVGFHDNATNEKVIVHSKQEKIPKKLLSKRKP